MAREIELSPHTRLETYAGLAHLAGAVAKLREEAGRLVPQLDGRRVWMINSTATGGGVAEMLPHLVALLRDLGVDAHWAVIEPRHPEPFFALTKTIHNMMHGVPPGADEPQLDAEARAFYDDESAAAAESLGRLVARDDILAVHDPQPLGAGALLQRTHGMLAVWRCHIGLDERSAPVVESWEFLRPYVETYDHTVFSTPEYIPEFVVDRASIIHPALDPLSHKNRELRPHKLMGILCDSGLAESQAPLVSPPWEHQARRVQPDGGLGLPTEPEPIGLPERPLITQVSRWDRLKGFEPLLEAFVILKRDGRVRAGEHPRHARRRELARLVLAGPDPEAVADDPEGAEVFDRLRRRYLELEPAMQRDVAIITLPMASRKLNALMVNALQRSSIIVVQNSLREGFGLTLTEAMWKGVPVLGNTRACGLRHQVRDGVDGRMVADPEDPHEIARALDQMLGAPHEIEMWAESAQRRVYDEFLVFTQLRRWLEVLAGVASSRR